MSHISAVRPFHLVTCMNVICSINGYVLHTLSKHLHVHTYSHLSDEFKLRKQPRKTSNDVI